MKEAIKSPQATKASMSSAMIKAEQLTGELKELTLSVGRSETLKDLQESHVKRCKRGAYMEVVELQRKFSLGFLWH